MSMHWCFARLPHWTMWMAVTSSFMRLKGFDYQPVYSGKKDEL